MRLLEKLIIKKLLISIDWHKKNNRDSLHVDTYLGVYFYRFNTERKPLDDVRVRLALALSIDREALVKHVLRAGQQPAYNLSLIHI